ncbi:MAG: ComEC/Rec2 family competence protein [Bacteroidales bacterium]
MYILKRPDKVKRNLLVYLSFLLLVFAACSDDNNQFLVPSDPEDEIFEVHFIDVGQGDAIFIKTPDKVMLVDAGKSQSNVSDYLLSHDIEEIDIVIGTHPHFDHIGGLVDVFHTFEIGEVIDPGAEHDSYTYNEYISTIEGYNMDLTIGRKGMTWELSENASMELLHPQEPLHWNLNDVSIVANITLGEVKVLLTGDAESHSESQMLEEPELLEADILKVGHHGSYTSSSTDFLEAVDPEVSVIMCGEDNDYGHPHDDALERLNATGTDIYRTDTHGHIVFEIEDGEYTIVDNS